MLQVTGLDVARGKRLLCRNLELHIQPGEIWAILGPNGCGKTTLLHTLAGLLPAVVGEITLNDQSLQHYHRKQLARQLGLLVQHQEDSFPLTVYEVAEQACFPHHALWQSPSPEQHNAIEQAIDDFELSALATRDIRSLSGGERQRVALACLQIQHPNLWLLDEPTNHLDIPHQLNLLQRLTHISRDEHAAMLMALHDINHATRVASHCLLLLEHGEWLAGETTTVITGKNLQQLYGCEFSRVQDSEGTDYWFAKQVTPPRARGGVAGHLDR